MRYFEHPMWFLLAGVATLLLAALVWQSRKVRRSRCEHLGVTPTPLSWARGLALLSAVAFFGIAAAGPRWGDSAHVMTAAGCDLAIVIDVSRSMSAKDAMPDRLARAQELASQAVSSLAKQGGHRVAVIAFASRPALVAPLTYDLDFIRTALADFDAPSLRVAPGNTISGTRIGAGLELAVATLATGRHGAGLIMLLSDGDDPANDGEWLRGADAAAKAHIPVGVIGIGDTNRDANVPGRPNAHTRQRVTLLQDIASRTAGRYLDGQPQGADAVGFVRATLADRPHVDDPELAVARSPGRPAPFLAVGLVLLIVGLSGLRWRAASVGVAVAAMAAGPIDDWLRRGDSALAAGQPEKALHWYTKAEGRAPDPGLVAFNEGVALAALGQWREAELHFRWCLSDAEGQRRARALFNMATCLVRRSAGREREPLQAAVTALEQATLILPTGDPLDHTVRENLAIAKALLAQAPAEQPNGPPDEPGSEPGKNGRQGNQSDNGSKPDSANPSGGPAPGESPKSTDQQTPGKGSVPPLADSDQPTQLTKEDLETHLRRAMERIAAARRERVKAREPEKPPSYPDW